MQHPTMYTVPDPAAKRSFHRLPESRSDYSVSTAYEEYQLGPSRREFKGYPDAPGTPVYEEETEQRSWLTKRKAIAIAAIIAMVVIISISIAVAVRSLASIETSKAALAAAAAGYTSTGTGSAASTKTAAVTSAALAATQSPVAVEDPTIAKSGGMCGPVQVTGRDLATYPRALKCPTGECCGKAGWCGVGATFCGTLCQADYGICGGDLTNGYKRSALRTAKAAVMVGTKEADYTKPMCQKPGQVAITFDDGPYIFTEKILDDLKALNVKATFFVNGRNYGDIYEYNKTLTRAIAEGHQIGHHTWSHPLISDKVAVPNFAALDKNELVPLESALKSITGLVPTYLRPPSGEFPAEYLPLVGAAGYSHVVVWNLNTLDTWGCETAACVSQNTAKALVGQTPATASFVQLSHDPLKITSDGWAATVTLYRNAGFTQFVTVHECLTGLATLTQAYSP